MMVQLVLGQVGERAQCQGSSASVLRVLDSTQSDFPSHSAVVV
jgi:hypothetical protein